MSYKDISQLKNLVQVHFEYITFSEDPLKYITSQNIVKISID